MKHNNIKRVRESWDDYPDARLYLGVVDYKSELVGPHSCKKNEFWLGIIEGRSNDIIHVIKYNFDFEKELDKKFNELSLGELNELGLLPMGKFICDCCGELDLNMSKKGSNYFCSDCYVK